VIATPESRDDLVPNHPISISSSRTPQADTDLGPRVAPSIGHSAANLPSGQISTLASPPFLEDFESPGPSQVNAECWFDMGDMNGFSVDVARNEMIASGWFELFLLSFQPIFTDWMAGGANEGISFWCSRPERSCRSHVRVSAKCSNSNRH
jgi:hypothetical protein